MWITDKGIAERYFKFVNEALTNDALFDSFKSNNDYISVVGMSYTSQVERFLKVIIQFPEVYEKLQIFQRNDLYGRPDLVDVKGMPIFGSMKISANTLRHVQTLCHLKYFFGSLDRKVITELGVGYGATAFVVGMYFTPKSYHLVDVPDVQKFALKYLSKLYIKATDEPPPEEVDLFISEFCISEFDDEDLYKFYDKYVKKAKGAYLNMNLFDETRKQRFLDTMSKDFTVTYMPDDHGSHFPTYTLVGKKA